jgi:hypothetical protein
MEVILIYRYDISIHHIVISYFLIYIFYRLYLIKLVLQKLYVRNRKAVPGALNIIVKNYPKFPIATWQDGYQFPFSQLVDYEKCAI